MKEILGEDAPTKERDVHILLSFYKKFKKNGPQKGTVLIMCFESFWAK